MAVVYKLQKNIKKMRDSRITSIPLFFETKKYLEMNGRILNRNTLVEEKGNRMPRYIVSSQYNEDVINTETRSYSQLQDARIAGGLRPFSSDETILTNSVVFDDGTEIVAGDNAGTSFTVLYQYKYGEIVNTLEMTNSSGKVSFVKLNEGMFVLLRNATNFNFNGFKTTGLLGIDSLIKINHYNKPSLNPTTAKSSLPGTFYDQMTTASNNTSTSIAASSVAYESINYYDSLVLFDKNLNLIKEIHITGEVLNIVGKASDDSLVAVTQNHTLSTSEGGFSTNINVVSISPSLVQTTLFSETIRVTREDATTKYTSLTVQNIIFDSEKSSILFVNSVAGTKLREVHIDVNLLKVTDTKTIELPDSLAIHKYNDNFTRILRTQLGRVKKGGKEYYFVAPTIAPISDIYYNDHLAVSGLTSTQRLGAGYAANLAKNHKSEEFPLKVFTISELGEVNVTDTIPFREIENNGLRAVFTVGKEFILTVRDSGMNLYSLLDGGRLSLVENISTPIRSMGIDSSERIWYIPNVTDYSLEMISPYLSVDVLVSFEDTNLSYIDKSIDTAVIVEAVNTSGSRQEVEVRLVIDGNAIFRDSQSKAITITTNSLDVVRVPLVITGSGSINVYTTYNG